MKIMYFAFDFLFLFLSKDFLSDLWWTRWWICKMFHLQGSEQTTYSYVDDWNNISWHLWRMSEVWVFKMRQTTQKILPQYQTPTSTGSPTTYIGRYVQHTRKHHKQIIASQLTGRQWYCGNLCINNNNKGEWKYLLQQRQRCYEWQHDIIVCGRRCLQWLQSSCCGCVLYLVLVVVWFGLW